IAPSIRWFWLRVSWRLSPTFEGRRFALVCGRGGCRRVCGRSPSGSGRRQRGHLTLHGIRFRHPCPFHLAYAQIGIERIVLRDGEIVRETQVLRETVGGVERPLSARENALFQCAVIEPAPEGSRLIGSLFR